MHTHLRPSDICDALDELGQTPRIIHPGLIALSGNAQISGPSWTLRAALNPSGRPTHGRGLAEAVNAIPAGSIVVIDAAGVPFAVWGSIMTAAARKRGARGVICSGVIRDVAETCGQLPIFAAGVSPLRFAGRADVVTREEPISIGGVVINPRDHVYADPDGIVIVPSADVIAVEAVAREICVRESGILAALAAGQELDAALAAYRGRARLTSD